MNRDNIYECIQGDEQWLSVRCGCVTSSRVAAALSFLKRKSKNGKKGEESQARIDLRTELMCEILTKQPSDHYVSRWMQEGKDKEPLARAAYERATGLNTEQVGFVFHPTIKLAGCSPDVLVGDKGGAEFKCPRQHTHLGYLINGVVPEEYRPQCYWIMACCELDWIDFGSHAPEFRRKEFKTFIQRLWRDDKIIREMETGVQQFNNEVQEALLKLDPDYIENQLAASIKKAREKKAQQHDPSMEIQDEDFKYLCPR